MMNQVEVSMKLDKAIKAVEALKVEGAAAILDAWKQGWTHKELLKRLREVKDKAPDDLPQWAELELRSYLDGYMDAITRANTAFLYEVRGNLYKTCSTPLWAVNEVGAELPYWDTMPREDWRTLSEKGAIYWVYRDRPPTLYYRSESESESESDNNDQN